MKNRLALGITIIIAVLVGLPIALAQEEHDEPGVSGERDFRLYCAACHGENAKGDGPASFALTKPAPDLTLLSQRNEGNFPQDRVARMIDGREELRTHGTREMPAWGDWFKIEAAQGLGGAEGGEGSVERRINNLIDYLQSIQE